MHIIPDCDIDGLHGYDAIKDHAPLVNLVLSNTRHGHVAGIVLYDDSGNVIQAQLSTQKRAKFLQDAEDILSPGDFATLKRNVLKGAVALPDILKDIPFIKEHHGKGEVHHDYRLKNRLAQLFARDAVVTGSLIPVGTLKSAYKETHRIFDHFGGTNAPGVASLARLAIGCGQSDDVKAVLEAREIIVPGLRDAWDSTLHEVTGLTASKMDTMHQFKATALMGMEFEALQYSEGRARGMGLTLADKVKQFHKARHMG